MQQHAGLLFLSKKTAKVFLILEHDKWTLPTFVRRDTLLNDAQHLLTKYSQGKIVPIELYLSEDKGFEFGTYICLVDNEFVIDDEITFCWANLNTLPKQLHTGLKTTLNNQIIRTKIETILELEHDINSKTS